MMSLFRKKQTAQASSDPAWITATEARKLAKANTKTGYNVADSIREKATAGIFTLYVNSAKLTKEDILALNASGFKVRGVKNADKIAYYSIEW